MPLKSGLEVYFYNLAGAALGSTPYGDFVKQLTFTTVSPGGFGDFSCQIALKDARLPRTELGLFSRVAVMDGLSPVWLGEISEAAIWLDAQQGEYAQISALGLGNCLRDDPRDDAYTNSTAQAIINSQMTSGNRANFLIIDADQTAVFPDAPATTYSPVYPLKTMEEVINDVVTLASGGGQEYAWGVWAHPQNKDAALYPTGQLQIHLKDTSTIGYQAWQEAADILGWTVSPSAERAFNVVAIKYNDPSQTTPVGVATFTDARLAANGSQGTAPFRRRKYAQDFSGITTVSKTQAQNVANTFGGTYKNLTNKVEIVLAGARDANGAPINIWGLRADKNIYVPSLAVRGAQLALAATAGTNLFYIVQTTYAEDDQGHTMTLECDNFDDSGTNQIARLQLRADEQLRAGGTTSGVVQSLGAPLRGGVAYKVNPTGNAQVWSNTLVYGCSLSQAPTSVTLSAAASSNITGTSVTQMGVSYSMFNMTVTSSASPGEWDGTFQTSGNCLLDVDEARETFAHHCDVCAREGRVAVRRGLRLREHLRMHTDLHETQGAAPGYSALCFDCPGCGTRERLSGGAHPRVVESFNTNLGPEDEDAERVSNHAWRARQAHLIRRVMRFHGLATRQTPLEGMAA